MSNPDSYFLRKEVSNSDLTDVKSLLYPRLQYGDKEKAFRFGSLVDAIITEPDRVNYYAFTIDDMQKYSQEEFAHAESMNRALRNYARNDPFLMQVLNRAETQRFMINKEQQFEYSGFEYKLDTRCKWDWYFPVEQFGGDLKTTFASTDKQFHDAIDFFDWDRSRAWYMDIAGSDMDFIYAISKKNNRIFKKMIRRGDETYLRGREKYLDLSFKYWLMFA